MFVILTVPAPAFVSENAPVREGMVSESASDPMVLALAIATAVPQILLPLMLRRAPFPPPVPLIVSASAGVVMPPWICSDAPLATVVPAPIVPRAVACWMLSTPAATVVAPV